MTHSEFHIPWVEETWETPENALRNTDGARLYETDDRALLHKIIHNDLPRLKEYIAVYSPLHIETMENTDPFCIAAAKGRTNALRTLVDYYNTDPKKVPLDQRMLPVFTPACKEAQLETAQLSWTVCMNSA
ncbi:hypothetical protein N7449_012310 [Penicillium cf. viridicatum]|uniref:Uncharacterized protein n=1 Tax=Penicillium cf. viridicatum TaxID=2972119 RepID=A0A9W9IQ17_9EURO|nr:hypothetical protein N7449_012310 [Penicillium cf. viridicatum]